MQKNVNKCLFLFIPHHKSCTGLWCASNAVLKLFWAPETRDPEGLGAAKWDKHHHAPSTFILSIPFPTLFLSLWHGFYAPIPRQQMRVHRFHFPLFEANWKSSAEGGEREFTAVSEWHMKTESISSPTSLCRTLQDPIQSSDSNQKVLITLNKF